MYLRKSWDSASSKQSQSLSDYVKALFSATKQNKYEHFLAVQGKELFHSLCVEGESTDTRVVFIWRVSQYIPW